MYNLALEVTLLRTTAFRAAAVVLAAATCLPAALLVGITDLDDSANLFSIDANTVWGVRWSQNVTATNVSIGALLGRQGDPEQHVGYLMTQIGPGTDSTHEVTPPFTFDVTSVIADPLELDDDPYTAIFSGLTLGPGTYYLLIAFGQRAGNADVLWYGETNHPSDIQYNLAPGFDELGGGAFGASRSSYIPASDFSQNTIASPFFRVEGDISPVPEPSSALLVIGALAAVRMRRRFTGAWRS